MAGLLADGQGPGAHALEHLLQIDHAQAVVGGDVLPGDAHGPQQAAADDAGPVLAGGAVEQHRALGLGAGRHHGANPVGVLLGPLDVDLVPGKGPLGQVLLFKGLRPAGQGDFPVGQHALQGAGPPGDFRLAPEVDGLAQTPAAEKVDARRGQAAGGLAPQKYPEPGHAALGRVAPQVPAVVEPRRRQMSHRCHIPRLLIFPILSQIAPLRQFDVISPFPAALFPRNTHCTVRTSLV